MSYLVLARKWRPKKFSELIGQEHVTRTLKNAVTSGHLAHAYIFSGPRGIGKTSTARILAKVLNCPQIKDAVPCNKCSVCLEIAEGNNIDVLEIDGASNRGIDEIRNLRDSVRYTPSQGKYRVYIIDEVHMLTTEAFNALLKTLEEPSEHVKFIFATTEPHKIPLTILSRCQHFSFKRIQTQDLVEHLKHMVKTEKIKVTDEALFLIAKNADGSIRDAQSVLDQLISFSPDKEITVHTVNSLLGLVSHDVYFQFAENILRKDIVKLLMLVDKLVNEGRDIGQVANGLITYFRNLFFISLGEHGEELVDVSQDTKETLVLQANQFPKGRLWQILEMISSLEKNIRTTRTPRAFLEIAMIKIHNTMSPVMVEEIVGKLVELEKKLEKGTNYSVSEPVTKTDPYVKPEPVFIPVQQQKPAQAEPVQQDLTIDIVKQKWPEVISTLKKQKMILGVFLSEGAPINLKMSTLEIGFGPNARLFLEKVEAERKFIEETLLKVLEHNITVKCVQMEKDNHVFKNNEGSKNQQVGEQNEQNEKLLQDPAVKTVMEKFGAKVVKISKKKEDAKNGRDR
ncbi:DNA polymerase III subunit gamma/tau [bacterium]|nr:DNA polymerase III subunit gamma/tau [bacterium]